MKRNRVIIGIIVVALVIVAAIFVFRQLTTAPTATVQAQTTTVQRGTLVATVNAAGNVLAPEDAVLSFQTSGRVATVSVQVGDPVKKGQVLMELDTADLELALKTAQTNFVSAQANFEATKANLQFALRNAQSNFTSAQANLEAAKAKNAQNANSLLVAKAQLDKATIALQKAQGDYNAIAWRGDVGMTTQAQTLQTATIDYQSALANYQITAANINDSALKQAQTQFDSAQVALEQAQHNLDTSLRTAQASLENAETALEQAKRNLEKARLVAPFDGYVSAVNFSVGDTASGNAVTVVDLSKLQVRVTLAEVDVAKIKAGQTAQLTLDALPGKTYAAEVAAVGPVGVVTQGVVNYPVFVTLTQNDGAVKPGMTTSVSIIVERRENVLLVPNRAIRTSGNQKNVTVQYKGQNITVPVTVGLTNDQFAEITSGLQEGDTIVINPTQLRQSGGGGLGIPGGGMFVVKP